MSTAIVVPWCEKPFARRTQLQDSQLARSCFAVKTAIHLGWLPYLRQYLLEINQERDLSLRSNEPVQQ